jgi:hypothetical protein
VLARATDIESTDGGASLLALVLRNQSVPRVEGPVERELRRGLGTSPEKRDKKGRFLRCVGVHFHYYSTTHNGSRGGLADRVQGMINRHQTLTSLWYTDRANALSKLSSTKSHVRTAPTPDLMLCITHVLQLSHHASGFSSMDPQLRTALVRGIVVSGKMVDADEKGKGKAREKGKCGTELYLMLNYAARGATGIGRADGELVDGAVVGVWAPWCEVQVPVPEWLVGNPAPDATSEDTEEPGEEEVKARKAITIEDMPLPSPLGSAPRRSQECSQVPGGVGLNIGIPTILRQALLCERFAVMHRPEDDQ